MVDYFTVTQTPNAKNLRLYPNSDTGKKQFTPVGETSNYLCVDEQYDLSDNDSTYVYTNSLSQVTDIYNLQNHTTETGTINYVRVFTKTKSHIYTQNSSGVYKILISTSAATYHSNDINLTTDYSTYSEIWTTNPATGSAWTWSEIDSLKIGFTADSPIVTGYAVNKILRPNAVGSHTALNRNAEAENYLCVDDLIIDNESTYVYGGLTSWAYDLYEMEDHTTEAGTINYITVYAFVERYPHTGTLPPVCCLALKTPASAVVFGPRTDITFDTYTAVSMASYVNADTGLAWTWSDVDDLEVGVDMAKYATGPYPRCTQMLLVVNYIEDVSPEIRTTQCYAMVNYTPVSGTCNLRMPTGYTFSHGREIKKINLWNGERKVYDLQRNYKNLTLKGIEFNDGATVAIDRLNCIDLMKDNGAEITLSGFTDTNINTTWYIRDFTFNQDINNPVIWNWMLNLEKA